MRLVFFLVVLAISGVIWLVKQGAGYMVDSHELKDTTFKQQTQKTMDKSAKTLNWMDEQWKNAKDDATKDKGQASQEFKEFK
tara:strand:- start:970 stop:1215 length:246 start_codon:yes stop_codon:yes gene_type:complete